MFNAYFYSLVSTILASAQVFIWNHCRFSWYSVILNTANPNFIFISKFSFNLKSNRKV